MGCSHSRLDDEEAVQLCKDRKRFIKQAVEQRTLFASGHIAYIQSLKRVSAALRDYFEGEEPRKFTLDSFITPVKKTSPKTIEFGPNTTLNVNYLRPSSTPPISVEERPQSPETVRVETFAPMYGMDGFFGIQSSPMNSSIFPYSPNRPSIPPTSPQSSQWDFFWNPFSSLDYYGYPSQSSIDHVIMDDDNRGQRQVREEEGTPNLEEDETGKEERNVAEERTKIDINSSKEEVTVEDVDEHEEGEVKGGTDNEIAHEVTDSKESFQVSKVQTAGDIESSHQEKAIVNGEAKEETPGFTVCVNRKPTSMAEVIKDLEAQFTIVCSAANDVSVLLEAMKAQYSSTSNELSASKLLNPIALFHSPSSCSSSSRILMNFSSKEDEDYEGIDDPSEEHCMFSVSHQSTLDRLYAWEKKLYEEVKVLSITDGVERINTIFQLWVNMDKIKMAQKTSGTSYFSEVAGSQYFNAAMHHGSIWKQSLCINIGIGSAARVRIAYEKKCLQLRNFDVKGVKLSSVDKTRAAIRDLQTQIAVSIHSVEAISRRIETLRDEELHPQLLELLQGLAKMWKGMAECHQTQKRTLDEAKILLVDSDARKHSSTSITDPQRLARSASNLETELRNWRNTFELWITSQRSYVHALTGWLLRCVRCEPDASKLACSPRQSSGTHPLFGLCVQWSRRLDIIHETEVTNGIDFFAAGMGSLYAQHLTEDSRRNLKEHIENMEMGEVGKVEEEMNGEKLGEVAVKVLCAGMSVAMSSMAEFAVDSADGYNELVKKWENANLQHVSCET